MDDLTPEMIVLLRRFAASTDHKIMTDSLESDEVNQYRINHLLVHEYLIKSDVEAINKSTEYCFRYSFENHSLTVSPKGMDYLSALDYALEQERKHAAEEEEKSKAAARKEAKRENRAFGRDLLMVVIGAALSFLIDHASGILGFLKGLFPHMVP